MLISGFNSSRFLAPLSTMVICALLAPAGVAQPPVADARAVALEAANFSADTPPMPPPPVYQPTPEEIGDLNMLHHRYQAAIEAYRQTPLNSAAIWNKIGIANQQMFSLEEAKRSYLVSLKLEPNNPETLNNLATIFYSEKQYGQAEKLYRKALKLDPKSALIYKNLGTNMLAKSKLKKAWVYYQTALILDPMIFERASHYKVGEPAPSQQRGAINYFLARSYALAGLKERAIECLSLALDQGFADRRMIMADKDLASLHDELAFHQLFADRHADLR